MGSKLTIAHFIYIVFLLRVELGGCEGAGGGRQKYHAQHKLIKFILLIWLEG